MKLWQDLFGTDYGLMSIAGIIFMMAWRSGSCASFCARSRSRPISNELTGRLQPLGASAASSSSAV